VSRTSHERRLRRIGRLPLAALFAVVLLAVAASPAFARVSITHHPSHVSTSNTAKFSWTKPRHASSRCSLNGGRFTWCGHARQYSHLKLGLQSFRLKVTKNGNTVRRAYGWRVVRPLRVASVTASCTGDVLSGTVNASGYNGDGFDVRLLQQQSEAWSPSGLKHHFVLSQSSSRSYDYSFNVASLGGDAFQATARGTSSAVVDAASCAPSAQVPEAPRPILLPLSIAGTFGLLGLVAYRRRRNPTTIA
jgi:hypothetical protein